MPVHSRLMELNTMINRILVATDASAASNRALEMAAQLAEQYKADLLIIHVIRDMQIPFEIKEIPELESDTIESFATARDEIMRKIAESVLRDAKQKAEKAGASKVQTTIGTGDPATSILDVATRRKADMIVIGTRGLGKIKGQILGSVSRKVTNNAETSCLIVR
jgi:nucleotide-binding universal stress UspA family protein